MDKASIQILTKSKNGKIKKLNGGNLAPPIVNEKAGYRIREEFQEMNIPITRLHDAPLENAGTRLVDIPLIFANFHADAADPRNYYFKQTDDYIKNCIELGTAIYYRLGVSIEHSVNKYFTEMPDPDQWIEVASGIIRHYTEGWADGFHFDIKYWEIWNEPECTDHDGVHLMWAGTLEEYNRFYVKVAKELKKRFSNLMIGGPAHCSFGDHSKEFIRYCAQEKAPLDFYSWHGYAREAEWLVSVPATVKKFLMENGYDKTELHLNEWHYFPLDWGKLRNEKAYRDQAYQIMRGLDSAAFLNSVMIGWQDTPLDLGFYYTVTATNWGVFDKYSLPTKSFYGMKAFGELIRYEERVKTVSGHQAVSVLAGENPSGDLCTLISCFKTGKIELELNLDDPTAYSSLEVYLLDDTHDLTLLNRIAKPSGKLELVLDSDSAVFLMKGIH